MCRLCFQSEASVCDNVLQMKHCVQVENSDETFLLSR